MNALEPPRIIKNGNDMTIEWPCPDYAYLLLDEFDQAQIMRDKPELDDAQQFTGYPFLLHIIKTLVIDEQSEGKNILEIGGGSTFGENTIARLRKLTDTENSEGSVEHHAYGIDERWGDELFLSNMWKYSWEDLLNIGESRWDCIFHHSIWPTNNAKKLTEITDKALAPGGHYIAFKKIPAGFEPIDKKILLRKGYDDQSFVFHYKEGVLVGDTLGFHVTILQKPSESSEIVRGVQDDSNGILAG